MFESNLFIAAGSNPAQNCGVMTHDDGARGRLYSCTLSIVSQMEMVPEVEDSVAVGLRTDGDVEVVLFVKLAGTPESRGAGTAGNVREEDACVCARPPAGPRNDNDWGDEIYLQ